MNIEWKDNAVCYADGKQWFFNNKVKPYKLVCNMHGTSLETLEGVLSFDDFQLNIPREGDYLRKEELDSEGKYNDVAEVLRLFGIVDPSENGYLSTYDVTLIDNDKLVDQGYYAHHHNLCKRELTYNQLMTIGAIKRLLDEQEAVKRCNVHKEGVDNHEVKNIKHNKAKQAYDILQSLDYAYDSVEQRWYKKGWV